MSGWADRAIHLLCASLIWIFSTHVCYSQADSIRNRKDQRLLLVGTGGGMLYAGSLVALNQYWYKGYPKSAFHFFNDDAEWLQMDKAGHSFTSYYEGVYGYQMMRWAGLSHKQAVWYGGAWGLMLETPIEILDGFSSHWGFSVGDMAANTLGSALFISQELGWERQRVQLKFSYYPTEYANVKPGLLGRGFLERVIKDYNGQTYWLSAGLSDLTALKRIPRWLNIAVGYGADGMIRGTVADQANDPAGAGFHRTRQFYLSLDVNTLELHTKSKFVNTLLHTIAFIKVPSPTLQYDTNQKVRFYLIYL